MFPILQVFYSLLSGCILSLGIPNNFYLYGIPAAGLFSATPLYIAINTSKSYKTAFLCGYIQTAVCHLLSSFWLGNFRGFAVFTLGASLVGTGFIGGFISFVSYFPILYSRKSEKLEENSGKSTLKIPFKILWFTFVYVIYEWCKSTGFLAYPWGTVSMTAFRWPLITQIADITGVWGVTFLFVFFSSCLGEAILILGKIQNCEAKKEIFNAFKRTFLCCVSFFLISTVYGAYQILKERKPAKTMNTVLVQQNNDSWNRNQRENIYISQRLSKKGTEEIRAKYGEETDLVVWSEAVLAKRFPNAENFYNHYPEDEPLLPFIKNLRTPFVIGGPYIMNAEKQDYGNGALLFDKNGKFRGAYIKMHLVPFAERIPGRQYQAIRKIVKKIAGSYGWAPGEKPVVFEIPLVSSQPKQNSKFDVVSLLEKKSGGADESEKNSVRITTPICFDDSAIEVCRAMFLSGTECFVNITNDSWSKTKSAETQHFAVAHYRSIEFRTTTIRAANAGLTAVISPTGKVLESLPLFEEGALSYKVPIFERQMTIFARFGNWLPHSAVILCLIFVIFKVRKNFEDENDEKEISTLCISHELDWSEPERKDGDERREQNKQNEKSISSYNKAFSINFSEWNF